MKDNQLFLVVALASLLFASDSLILTDTTGWNIYSGGGYHYGPSILIHPDTLIEIWTTIPGGGAWDYINYKKSSDKGKTWSDDVIALRPTSGSDDAFSTADPGVIKIDSFYYLGYTSTLDSRGTDNEVYIARSKNPVGPYEKWNGTGWGGNPKSFIRYTDSPDAYGAGEPSFVKKGDTIFIYYTWLSDTLNETRVAIASAKDPNWPGNLTQKGVAITRMGGGGTGGFQITEDSHDIKYCDSLGLFIAVSVVNRLKPNSQIAVYYSADGFHFRKGAYTNHATQVYAHNIGISGTLDGHIDLKYPAFISYAYGPNWAAWDTYFAPLKITGASLHTYDSVPGNILLESISEHSVAISWNGPASSTFEVFRNNAYFASTPGKFFTDTTVVESTTYTYQIRALNDIGLRSAFSAACTITTWSDKVAPHLDSIVTDERDSTKLILLFSEPLDSLSAMNIANYQFYPALEVQGVVFQSGQRQIGLTIAGMIPRAYSLTLSNIKDRATHQNDTTLVALFTYIRAEETFLSNRSFEHPFIASLTYTPVDSYWVFTGTSGIQRNGSAFGGAAAPEGKQTAFLQNGSAISQPFTSKSGQLSFSFFAAQRGSNTQGIEVYLDNIRINFFTPASNGFEAFHTATATVMAGTHTLKFQGTNVSGDNTAFIDSVTVKFTAATVASEENRLSESGSTLTVFPNPFNPCTKISFTQTQNGHVDMQIINMAGQKVFNSRTPFVKGNHSITWSARTSNGTPLPCGLYLLKITLGGKSFSNRLLLLK